MKEAKKIKLTFVILSLIIMSSCLGGREYTYQEIKKEYEIFCAPKKETLTAGPLCELNRDVSLQEAILLSLSNNPDNMMAKARINQARAMSQKAKAAFYPNISFYTEYVNSNAPSTYLFKKIDQRELPQSTNFNNPGSIDNFESGLTGRLNLYNSGKDLLRKKMALRDVDISLFDRKSLENNLIAEVINAYYDSLATKDYVKIAEESVLTIKAQLELMEVRYKAGGALKSDILSLKVRLAKAIEDVVRSKNRLKISLSALATIMGFNPDNEIKLIEPDIPKKDITGIPGTYEKGLVYGLKNRPEIFAIKEKLKKARMALDFIRAGYLPSLDLEGRYYMDDESFEYETNRDNHIVVLLLNWDIFSGFSTKASVRNGEEMIRELFGTERKIMLGLRLDIKNAYLRLSEAVARMEVAKSSVESANESLNLVKQQYDGGSVSITRYLEAKLDRSRSNLRFTDAYYDKEKALSDIQRAIGVLGKKEEEKNH